MKQDNGMKHTKGPWHLLPARTLVNVKGPRGEQLCQLELAKSQGKPIPPDAYLIAAAPEMLEALELLIHRLPDDLTDNADLADAALFASRVVAKARGDE